ncbi:MAG: AAA family ATPase [Candidatus Doudnabacteria bacterium]|nr:AAA family ATPase [Candidatus Doudnabacteria bacterium]
MNEQRKIIAVTGPSAAGKTTIGHYLSHHFNHEFEHIRLDDYLKDPKTFPINESGHKDWDHPNNFYFDELQKHLSQLKSGQTADWHTFAKDEKEKIYYYTLNPKKYIFVEGTMILMNEDLNRMYDLKIYLDVPIEVSLARRAERGKRDWGIDLIEYDKEVMVPVLEKHRRVQKFNTDYIVDGTKEPKTVAEEVRKLIYNVLQKNNSQPSSYLNEWEQTGI